MQRLFLLFLFTACCGSELIVNLPDADERNRSTSSSEVTPLRILSLNVGQGDATLILFPSGEAMLIDAGDEKIGGPHVLEALLSHGVTKLKFIVATHYHRDHIGGIPIVVRGSDGIFGTGDDFLPEHFYDRGEQYITPSETMRSYRAISSDRRQSLKPGDEIAFDGVLISVVASNGKLLNGEIIPAARENENALSLAFLISSEGFRFFVSGDLTGGGGNPPYTTPDIETPLAPLIGDIDLLRVSHHGSNSSTNQFFLDTLRPEVAIISVGDGNDFFHPHPSVINRLLKAGIQVFQTGRGWNDRNEVTVVNGDVVVEVFGERYEVVQK